MRRRLKAGALVYAVLIALVISLVTLAAMMAYDLHERRMASIGDIHRATRNAESGIALMLADESAGSPDGVRADLFGDGLDTVRAVRRPWGGYQLLISTAKSGLQTATQAVLAGTVPSHPNVTLFLADRGRPLSLCGDTRIAGLCQLPKAGVKRAYIEGKTYSGEHLIYGEQQVSTGEVPDHGIFPSSAHDRTDTEQMAFGEMDVLTVSRSFLGPPLHIYDMEEMVLERVDWSGHILVSSDVSITVRGNARLSRCILHAPKVTVEDRFRGDVQIYADSIFVSEEVRLDYPSGLYAINTERGLAVTIGDGSTVIGQVFLSRASDRRGILSIGRDAAVYGMVGNQGTTELKGSVHGQLMTDGFILRTPSSTYENHLLDAVISFEQLPTHYVGPFRSGGEHGMITRLE